MSGSVPTLPAAPLVGAQQMSPLGAAMLGPQQLGLQSPLAGSQMTPLMSMLMMQGLRQSGAQPGAGPGPASDAQMQAGWNGTGGNSMLGAMPTPGVPGPPGALQSTLPSWLGGSTATNQY